MQIGEAFVALRADTSKFGPEMSRGVEQAGQKASLSLGQALTGGAAIAGISHLVGSASDLNESMNKVQVTFGSASGSVEQFASTSAESLGISEAAALDLAGGLGAMLIPLGTSQEEAASMSTTLLTLAADMGSFNNQDPTEMLERLRSGLAGEAEPLRQFGVSLSEVRVQQYAWQNGIAENGEALTEQQKILGRYGLILEDTATQQGDFANTSDSAANAQRIAAATAEDSAASIGQNFLPIYEQAITVVTGLASAFGALPGPLQTVTVLLAAAVAFQGPVTKGFQAVSTAATNMGSRFTAAGGGASGLSAAITPGAMGTVAAAAGIALITSKINDMRAQQQAAKDSTKELTEAFAASGEAGLADNLLAQIALIGPEATDALTEADISARDLSEAAAQGADGLRPLLASLVQTGEISASTAVEIGTLAARSNDGRDAAGSLASAQDDNAEATAGATESIDDQVTSLTEIASTADAARDALNALHGIQMSLDEATTAVQETHDELSASLRENGHVWDENTQRGRDNVAAARAAGEAIAEQTISYRNNGASVAEASQSNRFFVQTLRDQLLAAGYSRDKTEELITTYARVPRKILSTIDANEQPAIDSVGHANSVANSQWAGKVFTATLGIATGAAVAGLQNLQSRANDLLADLAGRASGGPVERGTPYVVGERGPELFVPGQSGTIIPNNQAISGGTAVAAGGGDLHLHFGDVYGDPEAFARSIAPVVGRELAAIDRGV